MKPVTVLFCISFNGVERAFAIHELARAGADSLTARTAASIDIEERVSQEVGASGSIVLYRAGSPRGGLGSAEVSTRRTYLP